MRDGFVYLDEAVPGVRWDARYACAENFTGQVVEGYQVPRVVGSEELARGLRLAQNLAARHGLSLLLWDGYRPCRAVAWFLRWSALPEDGRTQARHYPRLDKGELVGRGYVAARSSHSRGSAIDLTLCQGLTGQPLDMGGSFDLMDERSHHGAQVPEPAAENRLLLRRIMEESGFCAYEREWWHYVLTPEPYPDTYFDFPIC